MFSQTLGTALGDWTADSAGFGYTGSAVLFSSMLCLLHDSVKSAPAKPESGINTGDHHAGTTVVLEGKIQRYLY